MHDDRARILKRWAWWLGLAGYLGVMGWLVAAQSPWSDVVLWSPLVVAILLRVVRRAGRTEHPVREAAAPAVSGLSELQSIYQGQVTPDELDLRPHDDVLTSLVVPYRDPLEDERWTIKKS